MKKLLLLLALICTTVVYSQMKISYATETTNAVSKNVAVKKPAMNFNVRVDCNLYGSPTGCHCASCTVYSISYTVGSDGSITLTGMTAVGSCPATQYEGCQGAANTLFIQSASFAPGQDYNKQLMGFIQTYLNDNPPPTDDNLKAKKLIKPIK